MNVSTAAPFQLLSGEEMELAIIYGEHSITSPSSSSFSHHLLLRRMVTCSHLFHATYMFICFDSNACGLYHKMNGTRRPLIKPQRRLVSTCFFLSLSYSPFSLFYLIMQSHAVSSVSSVTHLLASVTNFTLSPPVRSRQREREKEIAIMKLRKKIEIDSQ